FFSSRGRHTRFKCDWSSDVCSSDLIQYKLVDMAVDLDAARLLNYRAAWMLDRGMRVTRESAMAKLFASEAAVRIANEAVQIHGRSEERRVGEEMRKRWG